jgi:hypothetical protein
MTRLSARPNPTAKRYVTEITTMPRDQKPEGGQPLSNAERQARYRARHLTQPPPVVIRTRRAVDRRSRPQRWDDATNVLLGIQVECVDWLMALPDSLRGTTVAEALEAIADLDLSALAEIRPPRGYGRD